MRRYAGEELPAGCRIAVVANDALGNYVVSTPLLQMLRQRWRPSTLHYYSGTRTEELWMEDAKIDWGFPLFGSEPHFSVLSAFAETGHEPYDLVINLENSPWSKAFASTVAAMNTYICGPCVGADGRGDLPFEDDQQGRLWADKNWISVDLVINLENSPWSKAFASTVAAMNTYVSGPCVGADGRGDLPFEDDQQGRLWADKNWISVDLPLKYPFLKSGFIGEIFCRLAYLEGDVPPYEVPAREVRDAVPPVLISTAASLPEKLWPLEKWVEIIKRCKNEGLEVGLIGAKPTAQSRFWKGSDGEDELVRKRLVKDLRGAYRLPSVVGALSKARAVLTIDNGILHLAVGSGAPTIGLYRYGIHRLWAPPYENLTVLIPEAEQGVETIAVDDVWEAMQRAL